MWVERRSLIKSTEFILSYLEIIMALQRQEVQPMASAQAFIPAETNGFHDEDPFSSEVQAPVVQPVATVEAPAGVAVAAASAGQVSVVASAGGQVAVANQAARYRFDAEEMASLGYAGLVIDWTSQPMISLKTEGVFVDTEGRDFGKSFNCRIQETRNKYLYKGLAFKKEDVVCYSYDKVTTTSGELVTDIVAKWEADGRQIEGKTYLECLVEIVAPGDETDGELRMLSISPTSLGRFGALTRKLIMKFGPLALGEQVVRIYVGDKVTNVANPFYPWAFSTVV
jgi:hypothetical protein